MKTLTVKAVPFPAAAGSPRAGPSTIEWLDGPEEAVAVPTSSSPINIDILLAADQGLCGDGGSAGGQAADHHFRDVLTWRELPQPPPPRGAHFY